MVEVLSWHMRVVDVLYGLSVYVDRFYQMGENLLRVMDAWSCFFERGGGGFLRLTFVWWGVLPKL